LVGGGVGRVVNYKANIAGVTVVFVPPAYTSQTCSRCHHVHPVIGKSYRSNKSFKCGHCGFEHDSEALASLRASADINAALNIAALGVSVNNPEIPGIACLLEGQLSLFPTGGEIWDKAYSAFGTPNQCR
jgi:putative transposase